MDRWLGKLEASNWLTHVKEILTTACLAAQCIDRYVCLASLVRSLMEQLAQPLKQWRQVSTCSDRDCCASVKGQRSVEWCCEICWCKRILAIWSLGFVLVSCFPQDNSHLPSVSFRLRIPLSIGNVHYYGVSHLYFGFSSQGRCISVDSWDRRNWFHIAGDFSGPDHPGTKKQDHPRLWGPDRERVAAGEDAAGEEWEDCRGGVGGLPGIGIKSRWWG